MSWLFHSPWEELTSSLRRASPHHPKTVLNRTATESSSAGPSPRESWRTQASRPWRELCRSLSSAWAWTAPPRCRFHAAPWRIRPGGESCQAATRWRPWNSWPPRPPQRLESWLSTPGGPSAWRSTITVPARNLGIIGICLRALHGQLANVVGHALGCVDTRPA